MRTSKLLLVALAASILLAAAVSTASANNLSVSNQRVRVVWSAVNFNNNVGLPEVRCPLSLEGSFHSATLRKNVGALAGAVTRAEFGACTQGTATLFREMLPWHLTYEGFTGRLPTIEAVRLLLARGRFRTTTGGVTCNVSFGSEAGGNVTAEALLNASGVVTGLRLNEERLITLEGGGLCALGSGRFLGTGSVTVLSTTTAITVRLI